MDTTHSASKIIILAEDDAGDRMLFEEALNEVNAKTELVTAEDGVELMSTLDQTVPPKPHVIFLDLNMPLKNGFECLKEIRDTPKLKEIPVVVFSTTDNPNTVDATYALGQIFISANLNPSIS
jgi:CheY-like chemotaxis protein